MDTGRSSKATYAGLAGKTVFITGGGSGIGAAFTRAFAGQGARVAFVDIAEEVRDEMKEKTPTLAKLFEPAE